MDKKPAENPVGDYYEELIIDLLDEDLHGLIDDIDLEKLLALQQARDIAHIKLMT